ncbi:TXNDC11 family protein [Megaselia abdita]
MTKSLSISETESEEISRLEQPQNTTSYYVGLKEKTRLKMILKFSRELMCLLALILTTVASLQSRYSKYNKTAPVPIFPSYIDEWPSGALTPVQNKIAGNELSLVFYYAPWCAETHYAKTAFQEVAKFHSSDIYFAAVNCWRPMGECRQQHPKVSRWPILVAYLPNGIGFQYKGDWNFHDLGLFVDRLLKPLERITTSQELFNQKMSNDFVVLGLFEKLDSHYITFVQTALKSLELNRNIAFTVFVGNSSRNDLGNLNLTWKWPGIKIYNRFSSMEYSQPDWNLDNLMQWITNETRKQPLWYHFSAEKSFTLGNYLKSGQNIILFTPKTILKENNIEYLAFKQAFYAYKNCNNNPSINLIIKNIPIIQNENKKYINYLEKTCEEKFTNFESRWLNPENRVDYSCSVKKSIENNSTVLPLNERKCSNEPVQRNKVDKSSPEELLKKKHEKQCKYFFESRKYMTKLKIQEYDIPVNRQSFCFSNITLSFHVLDSLENYEFIRKIIPNLNSTTTESKVFIIDSDNERSFAQHKEPTFINYMEFINDFYSKTLKRLQRTTNIDDKRKVPFISFKELTSHSFKEIINREHENSLVMFYSPECALCNIMSRSLLQIQAVLKDMSNINFYRIDSENNDFNWEYTMETYPTLLFLPKNKSVFLLNNIIFLFLM